MASIIIPNRWRRQPEGPVELNPTHPLASRLVFGWLASQRDGRNIVDGRLPSVRTYVPKPHQRGNLGPFVVDVGTQRLEYSLNYGIGAVGGQTSWEVGFGAIASSGSQTFHASTRGGGVAMSMMGYADTFTPAFTIWGVAHYNSTATFNAYGGAYDGKMFSYGGTAKQGATARFFADGRVLGSDVAIGTSSAPGSTLVLFRSDPGTSVDLDQRIDHLYIWTDILANEAFWLLRNEPYALVRPINRRIYFDLGAGGTLSVTPSGIATAEAFGTARLDHGLTLTAIGSAEAFGTASLTVGQTISAAGAIGSAEAFGAARLDLGIALTGLATAEAFGTARLDYTLTATGITTAEAFGTAAVNLDAGQSVTVSGIGSAEAFGTAGLVQSGVIATAAIASAEAFGTAQLDFRLALAGAASAESFGTTQVALDTSQTVSAVGAIATAEAFGTERLDFGLLLTGVPSAGAFGATVVQGGVQDAFGEPFEGSSLSATDRRIGYATLVPGKGHIG